MISRAAAEPLNDLPDPEVEGAIQHAQVQINRHCDRVTGSWSLMWPSRPMSPAQEAENKRLWAQVLTHVLAEMRMPDAPS